MHNNLLLFLVPLWKGRVREKRKKRQCYHEGIKRGMRISMYTSLNNNTVVMTIESINFKCSPVRFITHERVEISKFICWLWIHECKLMHFSICAQPSSAKKNSSLLYFCIQLNYEKNAKDMAIMRYWLRDILLQFALFFKPFFLIIKSGRRWESENLLRKMLFEFLYVTKWVIRFIFLT